MKWGFLTLAAVLLVSCVSVTDGFAQGLSDTKLRELCRQGRVGACHRLHERDRQRLVPAQTSQGSSLEAGVKGWRVTPEGEFLCEVGSTVCDAVEGGARLVDTVVDTPARLVGTGERLVDTVTDTGERLVDTVTDTGGRLWDTGARTVDVIKAELNALLDKDEDAKRKLEEAKEDRSVATEAADTTHQEHRAFEGAFKQETLRRQEQRNKHATELGYARSRMQTSERNIGYAEKEYRATSQDHGRALATSYPSAGGGGTVETVLRFDCEELVAIGGMSMSDCQETKAFMMSEGLLNSDGSFLSDEEYLRRLAEARDSLAEDDSLRGLLSGLLSGGGGE